jgi:hypothetical protein
MRTFRFSFPSGRGKAKRKIEKLSEKKKENAVGVFDGDSVVKWQALPVKAAKNKPR